MQTFQMFPPIFFCLQRVLGALILSNRRHLTHLHVQWQRNTPKEKGFMKLIFKILSGLSWLSKDS